MTLRTCMVVSYADTMHPIISHISHASIAPGNDSFHHLLETNVSQSSIRIISVVILGFVVVFVPVHVHIVVIVDGVIVMDVGVNISINVDVFVIAVGVVDDVIDVVFVDVGVAIIDVVCVVVIVSLDEHCAAHGACVGYLEPGVGTMAAEDVVAASNSREKCIAIIMVMVIVIGGGLARGTVCGSRLGCGLFYDSGLA